MENPTAIILSRMVRASHLMDVIANNISNASTPGYKSLHLRTAAWIDRMKDVEAPDGGSTLAYARSNGTWQDTSEGAIRQTGNPLDLALTKTGYFTVQTPAGTRLTRDGQFTISSGGTLVNSSGYTVLDSTGQPITIPSGSKDISIKADGTLSASGAVVGQIAVVNVGDPQSLREEGGNLLRPSTTTIPVSNPGIIQGALEGSNVQPIKEISNMLQASQNFQMISQFLAAEQNRNQNATTKIVSPT